MNCICVFCRLFQEINRLNEDNTKLKNRLKDLESKVSKTFSKYQKYDLGVLGMHVLRYKYG